MDPRHQLYRSPTEWLRESPLASYVDAFTQHFAERRYAPNTVCTYLGVLPTSYAGRPDAGSTSAGSMNRRFGAFSTSTYHAATAHGR